MRNVIVVLSSVALAACGAPPPMDAAQFKPRIWNVRAGRIVTEKQLLIDLVGTRYRLLGEVHDNPAHHAIRARLISAIAAAGASPAVVLEQFDLDRDEELAAAQASGAGVERLVDAGGLDRKGWEWPLHKPILDAALSAHLPIRGGNLSRAELGGDLQAATDRSASAWSARLRAARWTDRQAADLRAEIVDSHCNKLPESVVPRLVLAQRARDAAMAEALVADATADGAILVAGNGHVRADRGVPVYLHAAGLRGADASSVSVGLIEVGPEDERARDFPRRVIAAHPGFDYVWLTRSVERDDPCVAVVAPVVRP